MVNRIKRISKEPGKNGHRANGVNGHTRNGATNGHAVDAAAPPITPDPDGRVAPAQVTEGRRTDGTFAPGNRLSRGNPFARRLAANRQEALNCTSAADVQAVI